VDAIQVVKRDHRRVEQLFKQFERAEKAERPAELKRVVQKLVRELSIHAAVEEQILYPALRRADESIEDEVLEALEEHHLVKLTLLELDKMSPEDERYRAKMTVLIESVRHHVEEEESDLLPRLSKAFPPRDRKEMGALLEEAKKAAPPSSASAPSSSTSSSPTCGWARWTGWRCCAPRSRRRRPRRSS